MWQEAGIKRLITLPEGGWTSSNKKFVKIAKKTGLLTAKKETKDGSVTITKTGSDKPIKVYITTPKLEKKKIMNAGADKLKIKGLKAGETTLSGTDKDGKTFTVAVTVEDIRVKTEKLLPAGKNKYKVELKPGEKTKIEFNAVKQPVIFKSSNGDKASYSTGIHRLLRMYWTLLQEY